MNHREAIETKAAIFEVRGDEPANAFLWDPAPEKTADPAGLTILDAMSFLAFSS